MSDRFLLLKVKAIDYKGGKCRKCGYDKCYAALEFHHRDPEEKEVVWRYLRRRSWDRIVLELDKCDLLCANCRREEHFDFNLLDEVRKRQETRKREPVESRECPVCNEFFKPKANETKICSVKCQRKHLERVDWPKDLPDLVIATSKSAVARSLGVSDKAVAKRLKNHH